MSDARSVARPLTERLARLGERGGPYGKLCREAAKELNALHDLMKISLQMADSAKSAWKGEPRSACEWCVDDEGIFYTACGHSFQFNDGGPRENGARFCQYCGGRISGVPHD